MCCEISLPDKSASWYDGHLLPLIQKRVVSGSYFECLCVVISDLPVMNEKINFWIRYSLKEWFTQKLICYIFKLGIIHI